MELQLGLAPIRTREVNSMKGFGVNLNGKERCLESRFDHGNNVYKRSFEEAFFEEGGGGSRNVKLSGLLCWNGQPNEEDDGKEEEKKSSSFTCDKNEEEENHVVGWPPIGTWRKKLRHRQQGGRIMKNRTARRGSR